MFSQQDSFPSVKLLHVFQFARISMYSCYLSNSATLILSAIKLLIRSKYFSRKETIPHYATSYLNRLFKAVACDKADKVSQYKKVPLYEIIRSLLKQWRITGWQKSIEKNRTWVYKIIQQLSSMINEHVTKYKRTRGRYDLLFGKSDTCLVTSELSLHFLVTVQSPILG
jgi:hypothetical protein